MALMAAYTFEAIQLKRIDRSLMEMQWKLLLRSFGVTLTSGFSFCVVDSLYFDEYWYECKIML